MVSPARHLLLAGLATLGATASARADDTDVINFRAAVAAQRDDNLFRTASGSATRPQAETISTTTVGIDIDKRLSRQRLVAQASWVDSRYQANSYLDAGLLRYNAKWLWEIGSHLKGELGADRNAAQNSFADFSGLRQRNIRVTESRRFSLDYAFHPSWHAIGGISRQTMTNQFLLAAESDFEADGASLGLRYTPASGNWASWQAKRSEGRYVKRPFDPALPNRFDNEYTQDGHEFLASWQPTGRSTVNGRLEYLRRRHAHFSDRDFSGWAGQATYLYQYSEKTSLTLTYLHDLNAFQQEANSFYVNDEVTVAGQWAATGKISFGAHLGYSRRRYEGALASYSGPRREDELSRIGLEISYRPSAWLELKGSVAREKRESNLPGQDFTSNQLFLSASARF